MRLHRGLAGQAPDPLIAAAEGAGRTPGYRSLAYVVFENLALADFGNRLPNLSFEVIADEDSTGRDWLADLVRTADASVGVLGPAGAIGFVAEEGRWRENAEVLALWLDAPVAFPDGRLKLGGPPRVVEIPASDVGATADPAEEVPSPERTLAVERRPAAWSAGHFDPARDYQRGVQTEWRPRPGRDMSLEAPVVASAAQARSVAARLLRRAEAAAETLELRLPFRWLWLAVGDVLRVEGIPGRWRIVRQRVEHGTVLVTCAALPPGGAAAPAAADPGRALPAPLVVVPPTELVLLEPAHDPWDAEAPPALFVAAAGRPGWTGAEVGVAPAGDPEVRPLGRLPAGRWAGRLLEALPPGPSTLWDEGNAILVETDGENDGPESRPARSVLAGANMLAVGAELLQFRTSEHLGGRLFRLSGLLRARGASAHQPAAIPPARAWQLSTGRSCSSGRSRPTSPGSASSCGPRAGATRPAAPSSWFGSREAAMRRLRPVMRGSSGCPTEASASRGSRATGRRSAGHRGGRGSPHGRWSGGSWNSRFPLSGRFLAPRSSGRSRISRQALGAPCGAGSSAWLPSAPGRSPCAPGR